MKVPTEGPKAVLTVHPELPKILREDTVILKCDVQGQNWKYLFKCGDKEHESKEKELKIRLNYTQTCKCLGRTLQNGDSSQWSNEMNLRVFDIINKPIVTIKPQSSVFTGDTVTLSCDVGPFTGQRITWYTNFSTIGAGDDTKTLTDVKISNGGMYKCAVEGGTQGPAVKLTVTERPKALLHVQPDGGIFKGQTVTFTCHIPDSDVTSWSYSWSKNDSVIQDSESQEYKISSVDESHAGLYSCRGRETKGSRNTHTSAQHTLIVSVHTEKPKAVLTVRPEPPKILKGDTVTLTCDIQEKEWKYVFQCGDNEHKSENKELKITVESTQKCKCSGWRRSLGPSEWSNEETLTVSDALADHTRLIAVSAGLGALVLLCFILLLLWCCKRKKDVGSLSPSADHQQHNISQTPEEERKKQTLRSDSVNDSSDVTYAQIEMKANVETKKKNKDDKENSRETPDTVYSKLKI
ncbi:B-cell receptor CD22 isoform X4 [Danio rerio]